MQVEVEEDPLAIGDHQVLVGAPEEGHVHPYLGRVHIKGVLDVRGPVSVEVYLELGRAVALLGAGYSYIHSYHYH